MSIPTMKSSAVMPLRDFKVSDVTPVTSIYTSKGTSGPSMLTIVNGNRVVLATEVVSHTGATADCIQLFLHEDGPIFCNNALDNINYFGLKPYGKKYAIYSRALVLELTETYELDFTGITSISFPKAEFITIEGEPAVLIPIIRSTSTQE